jgi:hypothetical protein
MPAQPDPHPPGPAEHAEQLRGVTGLAELVAEAESIWQARAVAAGEPGDQRPGWRTFEDAFPTFYEFTNRPR